MLYDNDKGEMLLDKLAPLVIERGFHSFLDYYYLLKYDDQSEEEWRKVMNAISVQETFFWREMDQIRALVDVLVPEWFEQRHGRRLRIWSAACATGEEPLSIAMALTEAGWFERIPIEIVATDASQAALKKAGEGLYRDRAFRNLPLPLREKYFTKEDNAWRVDPVLQSRVRWDLANLVNKTEIAEFAESPFIFCRNVFIYFSNEMIRRVVGTFADHIRKPAYLCVGVSESLLKVSNDFDLITVNDAFIYKLATDRAQSNKRDNSIQQR
ncbi:MAG TPA: protein-glutamate O-methyltransferase CheR [Pyrinomonadaceae bacterium]